jgi:hypothetical protein
MGAIMQDPKQFLKRYTYINNEIDRKLEEITRQRALSTKITQTISGDRVQTPQNNSGTQNISVKIIMLENQINDDIDKLIQVKKEIESAINQVDDNCLKLLLEYRYIDDMLWEEIALKMNYSYYHVVARLHPDALKKVKDVIECYIVKVV